MLQKLYDKYVCPHLINYAMQMKPFRKQREKVIPSASGRVLEIGIGSGLNFNYYNKENVAEVFAVEPDEILMEKAKQKILQSRTLLSQILKRKQEIKSKTVEFQTKGASSNYSIDNEKQNIKEDNSQKTSDSLEADFQRWELDSELEELRKNI